MTTETATALREKFAALLKELEEHQASGFIVLGLPHDKEKPEDKTSTLELMSWIGDGPKVQAQQIIASAVNHNNDVRDIIYSAMLTATLNKNS